MTRAATNSGIAQIARFARMVKVRTAAPSRSTPRTSTPLECSRTRAAKPGRCHGCVLCHLRSIAAQSRVTSAFSPSGQVSTAPSSALRA